MDKWLDNRTSLYENMDNRKVLVHSTAHTGLEQYTVRLRVGIKTQDNVVLSKAIAADLHKEYPYFDVSNRRTAYNVYVMFRVANTEFNGLIKVAEISMRFQELLTQYTLRYE